MYVYIYMYTHRKDRAWNNSDSAGFSPKKNNKKFAGVSRIMNTYTHTYTYTHTRTHTHRYILNPQTFFEAESSHGRSCVYIYICLNIHMHIVASNDAKGLVAAWCSVLQCVAVCGSVLQCVAVCCSVLQCVAVCAANQMMRKALCLHPPPCGVS